jgi:hypothetical protein
MTGERALVLIQVALSTTLVFGMALFTRTLYNLRTQDLGYSPERLVTARIDPIGAGYKGDEIGQIALFSRNCERCRGSLPYRIPTMACLPTANRARAFA